MRCLALFWLVCSAAALPLDGDQLEGSGGEPEQPATRSEGAGKSGARSLSTTDSDAILSQHFRMDDQGGFDYGFRSGDGTAVQGAGEQRRIGDAVGTVMHGSYSYIAPDGSTVAVTWVADEAGFRASGDVVPKPPAYVAELLERAESGTERKRPVRLDGQQAAPAPVAVQAIAPATVDGLDQEELPSASAASVATVDAAQSAEEVVVFVESVHADIEEDASDDAEEDDIADAEEDAVADAEEDVIADAEDDIADAEEDVIADTEKDAIANAEEDVIANADDAIADAEENVIANANDDIADAEEDAITDAEDDATAGAEDDATANGEDAFADAEEGPAAAVVTSSEAIISAEKAPATPEEAVVGIKDNLSASETTFVEHVQTNEIVSDVEEFLHVVRIDE